MKHNILSLSSMMRLSLFLLLSLIFTSARAASVAEADSAYANGKYKEALDIYSEILSSQGSSAPLLFNMGNAAFKADDYAKAALCYNRAHRLDPRNKNIRNNLQFLNNKVEDANRAELKGKRLSVAPDDLSFFQSVKNRVAVNVSSDFWAGWAAAAFLLAVVCGAIYIFLPQVMLRKTGFFGGLALLALSLIFLCFSWMAANEFRSKDQAIITQYKINLLSAPDDDAKPSSTPITRGTKVTLLEADENSSASEKADKAGEDTPKWYKVKLNHDFIGWIKSSDIEII